MTDKLADSELMQSCRKRLRFSETEDADDADAGSQHWLRLGETEDAVDAVAVSERRSPSSSRRRPQEGQRSERRFRSSSRRRPQEGQRSPRFFRRRSQEGQKFKLRSRSSLRHRDQEGQSSASKHEAEIEWKVWDDIEKRPQKEGLERDQWWADAVARAEANSARLKRKAQTRKPPGWLEKEGLPRYYKTRGD